MAKKERSAAKHVTKRRLARWQRERRRRHIINGAVVLVLAAALGVIIFGAVVSNTTPGIGWLTKVGANSYTVFEKEDYAFSLKLCTAGLYPSSGNASDDPLSALENNELLRQGAVEVGISVTEAEVDQTIREMLEEGQGNLSDVDLQASYEQVLASLGLSDEEFRDVMIIALLQTKMGDYLQDQILEVAEQVYARTIALSTEEEVSDVVGRLEGGEDFETLATELGSVEPSWIPKGVIGQEFDDVAFSIELGGVSEPILIGTAYFIFKVFEREERALDEALFEQLKASALTSWLLAQRAEKVERNPDLDLIEIYQWASEEIAQSG